MKLKVKRHLGMATSEILIILGFFVVVIYFSAPVTATFFEDIAQPVQKEKKTVSTKDPAASSEDKARSETRKPVSGSEKGSYDLRF